MDLSLWGSPFSPLYHQLFWNWTHRVMCWRPWCLLPSLSLHVVGNFIYSHGFCKLMTAKYPQVGLCSFQICNHLPNVCPHGSPKYLKFNRPLAKFTLSPKLLLPPSTKWCESKTWYHLFCFLLPLTLLSSPTVLPSKLSSLCFILIYTSITSYLDNCSCLLMGLAESS